LSSDAGGFQSKDKKYACIPFAQILISTAARHVHYGLNATYIDLGGLLNSYKM